MAPRKSTAHTAETTDQPATLTRYEIPAHQAKYMVTAPEMEEFLQRTFGAGLDFNVSTKSGRWIYHAQRKLTNREISKWIAEIHKRKEAEARAGGGMAISGRH